MKRVFPTLAFVGASVALEHYAQLRDLNACALAGLYDLRPAVVQDYTRRYRLPHIYESLEEILADASVHGVVCAGPARYRVLQQILQAGKSVMALRLLVGQREEAERLVALAQQQEVCYTVGFPQRYDLGIELAKRLCDDLRSSGTHGSLVGVDVQIYRGAGVPCAGENEESLEPSYPSSCQSEEQRRAYLSLLAIFAQSINLLQYLLADEPLQSRAARFRQEPMRLELRCGEVPIVLQGFSRKLGAWSMSIILTYQQGVLRINLPSNGGSSYSELSLQHTTEQHGIAVTRHYSEAGWACYLQAEDFVATLAGESSPRTTADAVLRETALLQSLIEIAENR